MKVTPSPLLMGKAGMGVVLPTTRNDEVIFILQVLMVTNTDDSELRRNPGKIRSHLNVFCPPLADCLLGSGFRRSDGKSPFIYKLPGGLRAPSWSFCLALT